MDIGSTAKDIIRAVAPGLGQALGGPLGGLAAREIASQILGDESASGADLTAALENASADQLQELARLDREFSAKMEELGVRVREIDAEDRASARQRQTALKDRTPALLGALIVAGFFGLLLTLMFFEIPPSSESIIKILVGVLGTVTVQVMNFFFGSSAGSSRKNDMIEKHILKPTPTASFDPSGGLY